jgi:hypothetical protein
VQRHGNYLRRSDPEQVSGDDGHRPDSRRRTGSPVHEADRHLYDIGRTTPDIRKETAQGAADHSQETLRTAVLTFPEGDVMAKNPRLAPVQAAVKMPTPQIKVLVCPLGGSKAKISRILSVAGMRAMSEVEGELVLLYFKKPSAKYGAKKPGGRGSKKR